MDDNKFYIRLWTLAAVFLSVLVSSCIAKEAYNQKLLNDAVMKGADPMAYSCAQGMGDKSAIVCAQYLAKGAKQ